MERRPELRRQRKEYCSLLRTAVWLTKIMVLSSFDNSSNEWKLKVFFFWRAQNQGRKVSASKKDTPYWNPSKTFQSSRYQTSMRELLKKRRGEKKESPSRSVMTCRVNGSMKGESFSQCWARANCLSKQIHLKCLAQKNPFIYSWPIANTTQRGRGQREHPNLRRCDGYCKGCWTLKRQVVWQ